MTNLITLLVLTSSLIFVGECAANKEIVQGININENIETKLRLAVENLPSQWANALDNAGDLPTELTDIFSKKLKNEQVVHFDFSEFSVLQNWFVKRRNKLRSSAHKARNLRLIRVDNKRLKLNFEYVIEEQFENSPLNIIRLKQSWLIDTSNAEQPRVVEIQESFLPPKINSGAKIQC